MVCGALLSLLAAAVRAAIQFSRRLDHAIGSRRRVAERMIEPIEVCFEYLVWSLQWACWLIDWIIRLPLIILDLLGIEFRVFLGVSVQILTDDAGNPAVPLETVRGWLRDARTILGRCRVDLILRRIDLIPKEGYLSSTSCAFSSIFRRFFTWFSSRSCAGSHRVTIYVVRSMGGASGCAYPGSSWAVVAGNADGTVIVHEIGHLCDLWAHSGDPNNVMTVRGGGSHDRITRGQRCMIRTSRFASFLN